MLRTLLVLLALQGTSLVFAQGSPAGGAAKGTGQKEVQMPESRVQETLQDARVKAFLKMVEATYDGTCARPSGAVKAKVRANGSGDFSSTFYEFQLSCTSKKKDGLGITTVDINAEFSPPRPGPLNLVLSVHLKE